jgi:outer membrane immunogenic protein
MRRLALALVASAALTQLASAADLPAKAYTKAPVMVTGYDWTGFYVGLNAGGTWAQDRLSSVPADAGTTAFWAACFAAGTCPRDYGSGSNNGNGEFGGQAGYNWQMQNFLFGVETDIQWTRASSDASVALANTGTGFVPFNGQASSQLRWFGTTRVRLGVLANPSWLVYATGGLAYGSVNRSWTANFPATGQLVSGSASQSAAGWTLGAGLEWMLTPNWILGAEYLYIKFNSNTFLASGVGSAGCTAANCNFNVSSSGLSANVARLKLSYKL